MKLINYIIIRPTHTPTHSPRHKPPQPLPLPHNSTESNIKTALSFLSGGLFEGLPVDFDIVLAVYDWDGVQFFVMNIVESSEDFPDVQFDLLEVDGILIKEMGLPVVHNFLDLPEIPLHYEIDLFLLLQG